MKSLKILSVLMVLIVLFFFVGCGKKDSDVTKKEDAKTETTEKKDVTIGDNTPVHLKYDIAVEKEKGTMELYYKGSNAKFIMSGKEAGKTFNMTMWVKDKILYILTESEGEKIAMKSDISKDPNFKDYRTFIDVKEELKDAKKEGTEEIMGYKCDIYKNKEGTASVYQDKVVLKSVDKDATFTAVLFEPDAKFGDDVFEPPKDINFIDMDKMK
ncbi:MAG: DUF4412 domain-containing protein [Ignavibacteria bacterium]|nr:DUF4412 domain-containing protein [Ignavibacteria bacterium]